MNDGVIKNGHRNGDSLPGYHPIGGRPTQGQIDDINQALQRAKSVTGIRNVLGSIQGVDASDGHLQLIEDIGREWGRKVAAKIGVTGAPQVQAIETEYAMRKLRQLYTQVFLFDLEHGTKTSGYIPKAFYEKRFQEKPTEFAAGANVAHGVRHRPSLTSALRVGLHAASQVLDEHNIDEQEVSFYDFGCGTGKPALYVRMKRQFANVVGIDYFQPLLEIGNANKAELAYTDGNNSKGRIAFKFHDAATFTDFRIPSRHGAVIGYTYNSFDKPIIEAVRDNLESTNIPTIFVYNKPLHRDAFATERGWKEEASYMTEDEDSQLAVFSRNFDHS